MLCATAVGIALVTGHLSPRAWGDEPKMPGETFDKIIQDLFDAEARGDAAAVTALFSRDGVLLPPGGVSPIEGADGIRRFFDEYVKTNRMDNHTVTRKVLLKSAPDTLIDAGTWSGDIRAHDGAQTNHATGTYLAVGLLVNGRWELWAASWQNNTTSSALPQVGASPSDK
jgi:ketosteroid isomerase-like protein